MLVQAIMNAVIQVAIFAIGPFICWVIMYRKRESFIKWIGLKQVRFLNKRKAWLFSVLSFVTFLFSGIVLLSFVEDKSILANGQFSSIDGQSILLILVYSVIQTGLSEEILFRGFLIKVFSQWWGFNIGNLLQALLFGLLHGVIFFHQMHGSIILLTIVFTASAGWLMGEVNERLGNGSIFPSWMIHSLMNISSSVLITMNVL